MISFVTRKNIKITFNMKKRKYYIVLYNPSIDGFSFGFHITRSSILSKIK